MTIELWHDACCESPIANDDAVKMAVIHRRYINPCPDMGSTPQEVDQWVHEAIESGEWWLSPLWMYDHSGTVYRHGGKNPFSCQWDSGRVGWIAIKISDFGPDTDFNKIAAGTCETYTAWANGDCWGWTVGDESCGGYYSEDEARAAAAEAESAARVPA